MAVSAAVLLFAAALAAYFALGHPIPEGKFSQVTEGMPDHEVRQLLGPPDSTLLSPGKTTYLYGIGLRRMQWCTMEVVFGPDGRVVRKSHDH